MLKIRMQRTGRTNDPSFRIIVTEHTQSPKAGDFVEKLGTYNPKTKERNLDAERVKYWMSVGAQPSSTMHNMLVTLGIVEGKKRNVLPQKSPVKKEVAEGAAEAAPAGADAPAPAPEAAAPAEQKEEAKVEEAPAAEAPEEKKEEAVSVGEEAKAA